MQLNSRKEYVQAQDNKYIFVLIFNALILLKRLLQTQLKSLVDLPRTWPPVSLWNTKLPGPTDFSGVCRACQGPRHGLSWRPPPCHRCQRRSGWPSTCALPRPRRLDQHGPEIFDRNLILFQVLIERCPTLSIAFTRPIPGKCSNISSPLVSLGEPLPCHWSD